MPLSAGRAARLEAPPHIERYLLDAETVVAAVRRHPIQLAEPLLSVAAGLLLVGWLSEVTPANVPYVLDVFWWAWFVLVGRALWHIVKWHNDWFIATDKRLLLTYGVITRRVAMMPLRKVTDLSYNRSPTGRLLGYGEFILESAGQDQAMRNVNWLPQPDDLYRRICGELFDPPKRPRPVPEAAAVGSAPRQEAPSGGSTSHHVTEVILRHQDGADPRASEGDGPDDRADPHKDPYDD